MRAVERHRGGLVAILIERHCAIAGAGEGRAAGVGEECDRVEPPDQQDSKRPQQKDPGASWSLGDGSFSHWSDPREEADAVRKRADPWIVSAWVLGQTGRLFREHGAGCTQLGIDEVAHLAGRSRSWLPRAVDEKGESNIRPDAQLLGSMRLHKVHLLRRVLVRQTGLVLQLRESALRRKVFSDPDDRLRGLGVFVRRDRASAIAK